MSLSRCALFALMVIGVVTGSLFSQDARTKLTLNRKINQHYRSNQVPGLAVMYAENGHTTYKNFKGYANIEKGYELTENHIMRHASVDKLIAAVLGLKLEEQGKLDLNKKVRYYLPELPANHNYRVIDLLTCRSGMRHYSINFTPGSWQTQHYDTAYDAYKLFWDDPLVNTDRSMFYSTPGYAGAAAVFEKVTGKPIAQIVRDEISSPYQLYSMAAEDKSVYKHNRVRIYEYDKDDPDTNKIIGRDDMSWKVLGGGMESTPKDLLRFLVLLGDGKIISPKNVKRLMKRIDTGESYAMGNNSSIVNGIRVIGKSGGQPGASTYVWLAPDTRQAMVVMINRWKKADARGLAGDLRNILLNKSQESNSADLIVTDFQRTGTPSYKDGKLHIPIRMRIQNKGKGPTFQKASNGIVEDRFVNAVRFRTRYYAVSLHQSMTGGEQSDWIKGTVSIPDQSKFYVGRTITIEAMADAPVSVADTSVDQKNGRVKESVETNNTKSLDVKIPRATNVQTGGNKSIQSGSNNGATDNQSSGQRRTIRNNDNNSRAKQRVQRRRGGG